CLTSGKNAEDAARGRRHITGRNGRSPPVHKLDKGSRLVRVQARRRKPQQSIHSKGGIAMKRILAVLLAAAGLSVASVSALADVTYVDQVSQIQVGTPINACSTVGSASFSGQATGGLPGTFNDTFCYIGPPPGPNVRETITNWPWTLAGNNLSFSGQFCNGGTIQWKGPGLEAA